MFWKPQVPVWHHAGRAASLTGGQMPSEILLHGLPFIMRRCGGFPSRWISWPPGLQTKVSTIGGINVVLCLEASVPLCVLHSCIKPLCLAKVNGEGS